MTVKALFYRLLFCVIFVQWANSDLFASFEFRTAGTQLMPLGISGVSISNQYSGLSNQAATAFQTKPSVGMYYALTGIAEGVNSIQGSGLYPLKKNGTLGINFNYFGFNLYNEKKAGISYALKLADFLSLGVQMDVLNMQIAGYGSRTTATFEMGTFVKVNKNIDIGAHVYNPLRMRVSDFTDERYPTVIRLGATYHTKDQLWVSAQVEKDLDQQLNFKTGVDYAPNEFLILRGSFQTLPVSGSFGAGVKFKGVQMEVIGAYQKVTGFSPHLGLSYVFK